MPLSVAVAEKVSPHYKNGLSIPRRQTWAGKHIAVFVSSISSVLVLPKSTANLINAEFIMLPQLHKAIDSVNECKLMLLTKMDVAG